MTFIKACILAIIATLFLTYVLGTTVTEMLNVQVTMDNHVIEPLKVISVSALVAVLLVVAAIAIVASVFGTIIFIFMLVAGAMFLLLLGVFWPIALCVFVIWLLVRSKPAMA